MGVFGLEKGAFFLKNGIGRIERFDYEALGICVGSGQVSEHSEGSTESIEDAGRHGNWGGLQYVQRWQSDRNEPLQDR